MTQGIIEPEDVRKGDKLKVEYKYDDIEMTRVGIAHEHTHGSWYTAKGASLGTHTTGAVIELLDRPVTVPTNNYAVVTFNRYAYPRVAVRYPHGKWTIQNGSGEWQDTKSSDEDFARLLGREFITNVKIVSEGVK